MAKDAGVRMLPVEQGPCVRRYMSAFVHNMSKRNTTTGQFQQTVRRKPTPPLPIHITRHRRDGRNRRKSVNHRPVADVASMQNTIDPGKVDAQNIIKLSVCIGNYANTESRHFHDIRLRSCTRVVEHCRTSPLDFEKIFASRELANPTIIPSVDGPLVKYS